MAFTVTATQGFELHRCVCKDEVIRLPGDPGVAYTRNEMLYRSTTAGSSGLFIKVGEGQAAPIGIVTKSVTMAGSSTAFQLPIDPAGDAASPTMLHVQSLVPHGTPIYKVAINGYFDETVVTYSAASVYIEETTGHGTDDYPNGALVYVYEGPGAGEMGVVDDYDHTGGAVSLLLQLHRKFNATLTTSSKLIVLSNDAAANSGISQFGRADNQDHNEIETDDGYDDGDWMIYGDWEEVRRLLAIGQLPVIQASTIII